MNLIEKLNSLLSNAKKIGRKQLITYLKYSILGGFIVSILFFLAIYFGLFGRVPTYNEVKLFRNMEASEVYSSDNVLLFRFDKENRINIPYDSIPKHLVNALVATEDTRFYEHNGVDIKSLFRVLFKTILMGDKSSGGGSTITQQLVKNYFPRKSYWILSTPINKLEEMVAAYKLEQHFTKEQLIEFYFNTVPFGDTAFGLESAAQRFFSTHASQLTIEQGSVLVGMLKATYTYNPLKNLEKSRSRRNVVLLLMKEAQYINQRQLDSISNIPLVTHKKQLTRHVGKARYFTEYVRLKMQEWQQENKKPSGKNYDLYKDGLKIYTSLNYEMQQYAEQAVSKRLKHLQREFEYQWRNNEPWSDVPIVLENSIKSSRRYRLLKEKGVSEDSIIKAFNTKRPMKLFSWDGEKQVMMSPLDSVKHYLKHLHASFIAIEPKSGHIKAYVGGIDERYFHYDHVTTKRQVGSTFKPFVFAAAVEKGVQPCDMYPNELIKYPQYEDWEPKNSDHIYGGEFSVWGALAASVNTVTVQLMEKAGLDNIINLAKAMGIETPLPKVASLALGTAELSLLEMARAYATFPNYGIPTTEKAVLKILDREGNTLPVFPEKVHKEVYSQRTAEIMVEMLKKVVVNGISAPLRYDFQLFYDLGGKTGTSQSHADGWFIGFTSNLVTAAWVGAENPSIHFKDMQYGQASYTTLPINGTFLGLLKNNPSFKYYLEGTFRVPSKEVQNLYTCMSRKNVPRRQIDTVSFVKRDSLNVTVKNDSLPKE